MAAAGRGVPGQRFPGRRGHRLGHRRPAPITRPGGTGATGKRGGHRSRAVRHHLDVRAGFRRPLQSGGLLRRRRLRRAALARRGGLPSRAGSGLHRRRRGREPDVRPGRSQHLRPAPGRARALPVRGDRHPRAAFGDLRPGPLGPVPGCPGGRRGLHRGGLLLYLLDQLRQPRDHPRPDVL